VGEGVAEAQHRHVVAHGRETALDRRTDALGRRIGRDELGVRRLQLVQLPEEQVVLPIGHRRCVEDVVPVVGILEQGPKLRGAGGRIRDGHRLRF
jgi:hypothetical protein